MIQLAHFEPRTGRFGSWACSLYAFQASSQEGKVPTKLRRIGQIAISLEG